MREVEWDDDTDQEAPCKGCGALSEACTCCLSCYEPCGSVGDICQACADRYDDYAASMDAAPWTDEEET